MDRLFSSRRERLLTLRTPGMKLTREGVAISLPFISLKLTNLDRLISISAVGDQNS